MSIKRKTSCCFTVHGLQSCTEDEGQELQDRSVLCLFQDKKNKHHNADKKAAFYELRAAAVCKSEHRHESVGEVLSSGLVCYMFLMDAL